MVFAQKFINTRWSVIWVAVAVLLLGSCALSQAQDTLNVCLEEPKWDTSGVGAGGPKGIRVAWRVGCDSGALPPTTYDSFVVWRAENPSFQPEPAQEETVIGGDSYLFQGLDTTEQHFFKVSAYRGAVLANWTGTVEWRPTSGLDTSTPVSLGYWFLWLLTKADILEEGSLTAWHDSSTMGQWAFSTIAAFFFLGIFVWIFRTGRMLRSTKVFLVDKDIDDYNECKAIMGQEEFSSLDPDQVAIIAKLVKNRLTRRHFKGILARLGSIPLPEFTVRHRKVPGRFRNIPTVRILLSSVASLDEPGELEKAMEVRILAEEEELRKRSFIDILWALGVTAPLVGLFGTVTGISMSFREIMVRSLAGEELLKALAKGIHEALYTTICGLIVGTVFMLAYYWYNNKLERVHAIWVVFASDFVDRLKHGIKDTWNQPAAKSEKKSS